MKHARSVKGWRMSAGQIAWFWRLWHDACATQGWDRLTAVERDAKRRQVLALLGFHSAKEIDMTNGFDDVKKHLLVLAEKVLNEQDLVDYFLHVGKEGASTPILVTEGQRRRYLHRIGEIAVELEEVMGDLEAASYLETIFKERFKLVFGVRTITALPTDELEKVVMTLDRRLKTQTEKAKAALATEHRGNGLL